MISFWSKYVCVKFPIALIGFYTVKPNALWVFDGVNRDWREGWLCEVEHL